MVSGAAPVAVRRLLSVEPSLVEHRLQGVRASAAAALASVVVAPKLSCISSVVAYGLSFSAACGIFSGQESNPCLPHWNVDSVPRASREAPET